MKIQKAFFNALLSACSVVFIVSTLSLLWFLDSLDIFVTEKGTHVYLYAPVFYLVVVLLFCLSMVFVILVYFKVIRLVYGTEKEDLNDGIEGLKYTDIEGGIVNRITRYSTAALLCCLAALVLLATYAVTYIVFQVI